VAVAMTAMRMTMRLMVGVIRHGQK